MAELNAIASKVWAFLKRPAVSHGLLVLALKSKYTAATAALLASAFGLQ